MKNQELSNIFFDATNSSNSGLTNLAIPFFYDEQQWGKYYQFDIPSIDYVSNQRSGSTTLFNSINRNLTIGEGSRTGTIETPQPRATPATSKIC